MKVIIDNEKEFDVLWMEGPTLADGTVWMKLESSEPLHKLAEAFENAGRIKRVADQTEETKTFIGLKLVQVKREKDNKIFLQFEQG